MRRLTRKEGEAVDILRYRIVDWVREFRDQAALHPAMGRPVDDQGRISMRPDEIGLFAAQAIVNSVTDNEVEMKPRGKKKRKR